MNKKQFDNMHFFWSCAILVCLCLTVFSLFFVSCSKAEPQTTGATQSPGQPTPGPSPSPGQQTPTPVPSGDPDGPGEGSVAVTVPAQTVLAETPDMGQAYVDSFIFLGDSTTYGLAAYDVVPDAQVWTPASGTLTLAYWATSPIVYPESGQELLIREAIELKEPAYLLITLGVNGVSFMDEEYFKSEYAKLIAAVQEGSPSTKIVINSIYPVASHYEQLQHINNTNITAANGWLQTLAETLGLPYLDSASVLIGDDGWLPESLQNGDGLHLNPDGFNRVIGYLRTHGYE